MNIFFFSLDPLQKIFFIVYIVEIYRRFSRFSNSKIEFSNRLLWKYTNRIFPTYFIVYSILLYFYLDISCKRIAIFHFILWKIYNYHNIKTNNLIFMRRFDRRCDHLQAIDKYLKYSYVIYYTIIMFIYDMTYLS